MKHIDLFSGIGGFALSARWTGRIETVQFVEIEPFCQRVLAKNFPQVPIHGDINTYSGLDWRGRVGLLTGGFPCQPFSVAGQRRGKDDDRHLWPAMLRVITEIRPTWVVGENTPGITSMELDSTLASLEARGYSAMSIEVPACAVDAWHKRERVWIIAHDDGIRHEQDEAHGFVSTRSWQSSLFDPDGCDAHANFDGVGSCEERLLSGQLLRDGNGDSPPQEQGGKQLIRRDYPHANGTGAERNGSQTVCDRERLQKQLHRGFEGIRERSVVFEPKLVRDIHGVSRTLDGFDGRDRLRALGNAIVPQICYVILMAILQVHNSQDCKA